MKCIDDCSLPFVHHNLGTFSFKKIYCINRSESVALKWSHTTSNYHFDFTPPTLDSIKEGLQIITKAQSKKHTVYIHCKAGRGRSAVITACYLMSVSASYLRHYLLLLVDLNSVTTGHQMMQLISSNRSDLK